MLKRRWLRYIEYQVALRRNNALDFDDLIVKTVELFRLFIVNREGQPNIEVYIWTKVTSNCMEEKRLRFFIPGVRR